MTVADMILAGGVGANVSMLVAIFHRLGGVGARLDQGARRLDDHEARLRAVEKGKHHAVA